MCKVNPISLFFLIILCVSLPAQSQTKEFITGADVSWLQEIESAGGVFKENGMPNDAMYLLKKHGFNYIRLRIWHTPQNGINGLDSVLVMARRAKQEGFKLLVDFHFSDWWADPSHQTKPAVWNGLSFSVLKDSVRTYVHNVFAALKKQQTLPDMVQFGNEIVCGMLWPDGYICGNGNPAAQWTNFTDLLKSADAGMQEVISPSDTVLKMIHIDRGGNYNSCKWFYDNIVANNVSFDVIGLSYYPWWHGTLADLQSTLTQVESRYKKNIVLAEIAYPFTLQAFDSETNIVGLANQVQSGYPATEEGQKSFLSEVIKTVKNVPNNHGMGVFYWEPAAITAPNRTSVWENLALFGRDGEVLSSIQAFETTPNDINEKSATSITKFVISVFPNPFNPITRIKYELPIQSKVTLIVYDLLGREIETLINKEQLPGVYEIPFTAAQLASGLYFYKLQAGDYLAIGKMILTK